MLADIAHAMGYLAGAVGIAAAVSFGLRAGWEIAHLVFGPFTIGMNTKITNGSAPQPSGEQK